MLFPRHADVILSGGTEILTHSELMLSFLISRSADDVSDRGVIFLYNLARESRSALKSKYDSIQVRAGYGERIGQIFDGEIVYLHKRADGLDEVTIIEALGKSQNLKNTIISQVYEGEVPARSVVSYLVAEMGLVAENMAHIPAGAMLEDVSLQGPAATVLTEVLDSLDPRIAWYEDYGVLRFRSPGQVGISRTSFLQINKDSGMVASPSEDVDGWSVTTLLDHRIKLDAQLIVQSILYGQLSAKVVGIEHSGGTRGGYMYTKAKMKEL